jgi:ribosomal protein S6--L-glutamate ligase
MRIAILTQAPNNYSSRRMVEVAKARGHEVEAIDYSRCYMNITSRRPEVLVSGRAIQVDAIIPRIGASQTFYGTAVVRQFEAMDVFTVNGSQAIARSRDKLRALQLLAAKGIGLPITGFARNPKDIDGVIELVGGAPLVIKLLEGTQGIGVVLAETHLAAESVISAFRQLEANILVQEFIREAEGADVRAFVVDGKVVASMTRQGPKGEFRSNLHRGGTAEAVKLSPEERSTAVRSAKILRLRVAGVDMLRSNHGPLVMEVNSSPGLEGIEKASGVDVAERIIRFVEEQALQDRKPADHIEG